MTITHPLCLYVDNSNIFHEGQRYAQQTKGEDRQAFRIQFANFLNVATLSDRPDELVWGGSTPPPTDSIWEKLRQSGVEPELIDRASSGENETVDHLIQLRMHRHARKYRTAPGAIVLATGDGKGYHNEEGFLYDIEGFVEDGWSLRLLSWSHACHRKLKAFAEQHGTFVPLEDYYANITFIQGGRRAIG